MLHLSSADAFFGPPGPPTLLALPLLQVYLQYLRITLHLGSADAFCGTLSNSANLQCCGSSSAREQH